MREAVKRARSFRLSSTRTETIVWRWLRDRRFRGYKFRRQHPIGGFIVDFRSVSLKVVIELDGAPHATELQQDYDDHRTRYLQRRGFTVIRVWNDEVRCEPTAVADYIELTIQTLTRRAAPPSPASGRGL